MNLDFTQMGMGVPNVLDVLKTRRLIARLGRARETRLGCVHSKRARALDDVRCIASCNPGGTLNVTVTIDFPLRERGSA